MKIVAPLPLDEHPDTCEVSTRCHVILQHLSPNLMAGAAVFSLAAAAAPVGAATFSSPRATAPAGAVAFSLFLVLLLLLVLLSFLLLVLLLLLVLPPSLLPV